MTNKQLYEKHAQKTLNKIAFTRDPRATSSIEDSIKNKPIYEFFDIGGKEYKAYKWIMEESKRYSIIMLQDILIDLLNVYSIPYERVNVLGELPQHAFLIVIDGIFYVFRDFGIMHRDIKKALTSARKDMNYETKEIIYVHDYAYTSIINHNDNKDDPTRGTGMYSLQWFFNEFFSSEEYDIFRETMNNFVKSAENYISLKVISILSPNILFSFKKDLDSKIKSFDYQSYIDSNGLTNTITDDQIKIIEKNFFKNKHYTTLKSNLNFADSFLTAEWLFQSIDNNKKIDLTPIALGFFKTVEQFLWDYIKLYKNQGKTISTNNGIIVVDDNMINNKKYNCTLGTLITFFSYEGNYNNGPTLLENGISLDTRTYIVQLLKKIKDNRNGYSHKDNLHDYDIVEESRNNAYLFFYLFLGAYKVPVLSDLQIETKDSQNSFYKICEYTQFHNMSIYQIISNNKDLGLFARKPDDEIKYDVDGNVYYSNLVFSNIKSKKVISFKENEINCISIREGHLQTTKKGIAIIMHDNYILHNGDFID